jgi:hypothetical protein
MIFCCCFNIFFVFTFGIVKKDDDVDEREEETKTRAKKFRFSSISLSEGNKIFFREIKTVIATFFTTFVKLFERNFSTFLGEEKV